MCTSFEEIGLAWTIVTRYLVNVIYSSDVKYDQSDQPCRNKICHGVQTNYNTKEHALKSILVIDLILSFYDLCIKDREKDKTV